MSRLFETIKVRNGVVFNIEAHTARMNRSRSIVFGCTDTIDLREALQVPTGNDGVVYKCRVEYSRTIERIEFLPYTIKSVNTLTLVESDSAEYDFKWIDRSIFDKLLENTGADDILIIKNGLITDSSFANIVFFDGTNWVTPSTPLLRGTKREQLLRDKKISEVEIRKGDLHLFTQAKLINAMIDLEESPIIGMRNIY
jgi:4-amino-4-deoxychorismate lyase